MNKYMKRDPMMSMLMLVILAMLFLAGCSPHKYDTSAMKRVDGWTKATDSLYISTSDFEEANVTLITDGKIGMVVDTGDKPEVAQRIIDHAAKNGIKIQYLVITHEHPDHNANIEMFQLPEANIIRPSTWAQNSDYLVGALPVKILETPGHIESGHLSVEIPGSEALISGDILYTCLPLQISYGADVPVLMDTIEKIKKKNYALVIPGHGKPTDGKTITKMALDYKKQMDKKIKEVIRSSGNITDVNRIKLEDVIEHYDWMDKGAQALHSGNLTETYIRFKKEMGGN